MSGITPKFGGQHAPQAMPQPKSLPPPPPPSTVDPVDKVLAVAKHLLDARQPFSVPYRKKYGDGLSSYCAAFVRWCFVEGLGRPQGILPIVGRPPYYKRHGIPYVGVLNTADGLAGDPVGRVAALKDVRRGDILLFRDTYAGGWVPGTITHVGIACSHVEMFDAGSGSIVHRRSFVSGFFSGKLVEVRRPHVFANGRAQEEKEKLASRLNFSGQHLAAKVRGRPVRDVTFGIGPSGTVTIDGKLSACKTVCVEIELDNGRWIKFEKHDGRSSTRAFEGITLSLKNGLLQVSNYALDLKNLKLQSTGYKPRSVHFVAWD